jgi:hypothetical protein
MRRIEYGAWLRAHPKRYSYSVITGYPAECAWVEKSLAVDMDLEYAKDRMVSVLDRLRFDKGQNPLCALIDGNPYTNLASYRRAANSYRNFLDAQNAPGEAYTDDTVTRFVPESPTVSRAQQDEPATVLLAAETGAVRTDLGDLVRKSTVSELLALHAAALDELRRREIVRSANAPGGDYAELLFSRAFGWTRAENSTAGYDAVDWSDRRYQIKSRRLSEQNGSRQLSAFRRLPDEHFDYLAAVLFEKDYKISKAAMIPHEVVVSLARFQEHTNSWKFLLDDAIWKLPNVRDVTQELKRAVKDLDPPDTADKSE